MSNPAHQIPKRKTATWQLHKLARAIRSAVSLQALVAAAVIMLLSSCTSYQHGHALPALQTVAQVDLTRYLGLWYEIGRYPNGFQNGCQDSTALYTARPDGEIDVLNSCRDEKDGRLREARGRAWVVDETSNARLKVSFFWPFRGDYWVIDLGREYEYAVIGTPDRRYLWILNRSPEMHPGMLEKILQNVEKQGFIRDNLLFHEREELL